jgi:hypothetical protein
MSKLLLYLIDKVKDGIHFFLHLIPILLQEAIFQMGHL